MAERQRRTAVSIIEEIRRRLVERQGELETLNRRRAVVLAQIDTLAETLDAVDGAGDAEA